MSLLCKAKTKPARLEDVLGILSSGFIKGTVGGFLKTSTAGEMIKGSHPVNREIRVGITHVSKSQILNSSQEEIAFK